ncbi:NUDIX hydrolase [Pseudothauera nasutitermitis]|uniref:NUDIX hydrolase n=1 Tax=Pseudothauera nasutitermitis TaxID=2565930 RepID=A0A4S4B0W6_9RHOO|nr:NUDIX domain-containing protein [Pseudothauera nasutitermitis]THF65692.1 NUDIX hydrolase [Pseudothauera nasutitermitis]
MNDQITQAVETLVAAVPDPARGLPDDIFYYISRTTPFINVDLLIQDERGRTLLAWRDDIHSGTGWHIPGGIIRFKETIASRIQQVALSEIGTPVEYDPEPLALNEMIHHDRDLRGHFISLLYRCRLDSAFIPKNAGLTPMDAGYLKWHEACPANMIAYHDVYRAYIRQP